MYLNRKYVNLVILTMESWPLLDSKGIRMQAQPREQKLEFFSFVYCFSHHDTASHDPESLVSCLYLQLKYLLDGAHCH